MSDTRMVNHLLTEARRQLQCVDSWDLRGISVENASLLKLNLFGIEDGINRIRKMIDKELEEESRESV